VHEPGRVDRDIADRSVGELVRLLGGRAAVDLLEALLGVVEARLGAEQEIVALDARDLNAVDAEQRVASSRGRMMGPNSPPASSVTTPTWLPNAPTPAIAKRPSSISAMSRGVWR